MNQKDYDVEVCHRCRLPHRASFPIEVLDDDQQPVIIFLCEHCIEYYWRIH